MLPTFQYVDLFAGIGGFHQAASSLGGECVFASEIDPYARKAYEANYGVEPAGDIRKVDAKDIPDHDVLLAGFPCQPFSIAGKGEGFKDTIRGTLFFEIARILEAKRPSMFVLENVKRLATHDKGKTWATIKRTLEDLGYRVHAKVLNALDFGLPQKRERMIIVGFLNQHEHFEFPPVDKWDRGALKDVLETNVDKKYYVSPEIAASRKAKHTSPYHPGIWHENKNGNVTSHPYSCALRAGASYNYLLVDGERRLTPREMLRLQGFPDSFKIVCSDAQTRKQAGNAVPVSMIRAVLQKTLPWMDGDKEEIEQNLDQKKE